MRGRDLRLEPLAGVRDVTSLLEMLSSPKKYQAAIGAMEKLRADINAEIELVGKAKDIVGLRADATRAAAEAKQLLQAAKERIKKRDGEVDRKLGKARADHDRIVAAERQENSDRARDLGSRLQAVGVREKKAATLMEQAEARAEETKKEADRVASLKEEYTLKIAAIEETLGKVR
jgi:hypothetical protein